MAMMPSPFHQQGACQCGAGIRRARRASPEPPAGAACGPAWADAARGRARWRVGGAPTWAPELVVAARLFPCRAARSRNGGFGVLRIRVGASACRRVRAVTARGQHKARRDVGLPTTFLWRRSRRFSRFP